MSLYLSSGKSGTGFKLLELHRISMDRYETDEFKKANGRIGMNEKPREDKKTYDGEVVKMVTKANKEGYKKPKRRLIKNNKLPNYVL